MIVLNILTLKKGLENQETFLPRANPLVFNLMMFNSGDDPATVAGWGRASLLATHHAHAAEAKSNISMTAIIYDTRPTRRNAIVALLQTKCEALKNSQSKRQHTPKRQDDRNAKQRPLLVPYSYTLMRAQEVGFLRHSPRPGPPRPRDRNDSAGLARTPQRSRSTEQVAKPYRR
jgi:hypothetical protein